jgi:hypothetical protein
MTAHRRPPVQFFEPRAVVTNNVPYSYTAPVDRAAARAAHPSAREAEEQPETPADGSEPATAPTEPAKEQEAQVTAPNGAALAPASNTRAALL